VLGTWLTEQGQAIVSDVHELELRVVTLLGLREHPLRNLTILPAVTGAPRDNGDPGHASS
jgi:hypothetical protein